MIVGTVIGSIDSTIHHPWYGGKKMLIVAKPSGDYLVAVDTVDAGVGDTVLVLDEGTGARQIFDSKDAPVRTVIVGIVDEMVGG